ncbi:MAG: GumC family protein [Terriglobales bacterium]
MSVENPETQLKPQDPDFDLPEPEGKPLHVYVAALLAKLRLLWAQRRYIARVSIAVAVASVVVSLVLPKRYTATAILMPPDSGAISGLTLLLGAKTGVGPALGNQVNEMLGGKTPGQLYIRAMQSRTVEDRIIDRFDLMKLYGAKLRRSARTRLEGSTELKEDRKSGVITVSFTDKDATRAAQIANAYPEELDHLLLHLSTSAGRRERQYFEEQLAAAKAELTKAARDLSEFAGKNVALDVPEQGKAAVEAIAAVQGQLIASEAELKGLLQVYTDSHERVQQVRAQIAELKRQLAQLGGKESAVGKGQAKDDKGDVYPNVRQLSVLGVPYMELYQRVKIQEAVVEGLSQQYEFAKLQEAREVPSVQVMDPAEVPEKKSFPPRALIVIACTLLAFCYAGARVIIAEWWAQADPADPWKQTLEPLVTEARQVMARRFRSHSGRPGWIGRFRRKPSDAEAQ